MILNPHVAEFIRENDDLIDSENWHDLLIAANTKLNRPAQKLLIEILETTLPQADLGEVQWELIYDALDDAIEMVEQNSIYPRPITLENILFYLPRFGLSINDITNGLLDDPAFEWETVNTNDKTLHKLIKYAKRPK